MPRGNRIKTAPTYIGKACRVCKNTLRYVRSNSCVECVRIYNQRRYETQKLSNNKQTFLDAILDSHIFYYMIKMQSTGWRNGINSLVSDGVVNKNEAKIIIDLLLKLEGELNTLLNKR